MEELFEAIFGNAFMEGGKLACQIQLAFVKTSLLKMLFVALSVVYPKVVHCIKYSGIRAISS